MAFGKRGTLSPSRKIRAKRRAYEERYRKEQHTVDLLKATCPQTSVPEVAKQADLCIPAGRVVVPTEQECPTVAPHPNMNTNTTGIKKKTIQY